MRKGRILVIAYGEFSGIRKSIVSALRSHGCEVVEEQHTLRCLRLRPVYLLLMAANAILLYGIRFRRHMDHTPVSAWVRSMANQVIVDRHHDIDAVLSLPRIVPNFHRKRRPGVRYAILTDHVNVLSKSTPSYGFCGPEREVSGVWNRTEGRVLAELDYGFVMGRFVKDSMVRDYGVDPRKVVVTGGGPNLDVDAERDGIVKDYSKKEILFVGLDAQRKGLRTLEHAFGKVVEEFPGARLHVAGVTGASGGGIIYHGVVRGAALKALFYGSQVFALPSFREPFGIVFLEAMWAKTACVGTTVGAMPEMIENGRTGYVVEPGNAEMLSARLLSLFRNPDRLKEMAERGYRVAQQRFGWERAASVISRCLLEGAPAEGRARGTCYGNGGEIQQAWHRGVPRPRAVGGDGAAGK